MSNINELIEKMKELSKRHEELQNEVLNNPDILQEDKDEFIKIRERFDKEEVEYKKYLENNKDRKIIGYDPETFKPIYE